MQSNEEFLEELARDLWNILYKLTWRGELFGPYGAIAVSKMRCEVLRVLGQETQGMVDLLSTYYTVLTNTRAQARLSGGSSLAAEDYLLRAVELPQEMIELIQSLESFGVKNLSTQALMILGRTSFVTGQYEKALEFDKLALSRDDISRPARALIMAGLGQTLIRLNNQEAWTFVRDALGLVAVALFDIKIRIRVFRTAAETFIYAAKLGLLIDNTRKTEYLKTAERLLNMAIELAQTHDLNDQLVKCQALHKELE